MTYKKNTKLFNDAGLNIDDPIYGTWWETTGHQHNSSSYNAAWDDFFIKHSNPTKDQILEYGRGLMQKHGLSIYF